MAERLQEFPRIGTGHPNSKYPWSEWLTGVWRIDRGTDFEPSLSNMRTALYRRAGKDGISVRVLTLREENALVFEFYAKNGHNPA